MGFHKFRIWDADIVESHNLPNQIYETVDINNKKRTIFIKLKLSLPPISKFEIWVHAIKF